MEDVQIIGLYWLRDENINRLKRTDSGITVNGTRVFTSAVLQAGDHLEVNLDAAERAAGTVCSTQ